MNVWLETPTGMQIPLHAVCTIGRSPRNTLVLKDAAISRRHALIHAQGNGEHWIVDLGSSNGIRLNGRRVTQPTPLQDRDQLEIVGSQFVFRQAEPSPETLFQGQTTLLRAQPAQAGKVWLLLVIADKPAVSAEPGAEEELSQMMGGWLLSCQQIIEEHAAAIGKYLGDGFLAYWPHLESAPAAAVAETVKQLKALQIPRHPRFRISLHRGAVSLEAGASVGPESLAGPEVHLLFRMERLARSLGRGLLLSEAAAAGLLPHRQSPSLGLHRLPDTDQDSELFG